MMASYRILRSYMKSVTPPKDHVLKDCCVVMDKSFFKNSYKNSGCQSLLGGEYDRYAEYLRSIFKPFKENNVTCFVIFNGGMDASLERRTEIHQSVINKANTITSVSEDEYCDPIFVKDIWTEVLDELQIRYYRTEYDSTNILLGVAMTLGCPLVTNNYEYALNYVSCIPTKSFNFKEFTCKIYDKKNPRAKNQRVRHELLPLLFTLTDDSSVYFSKLRYIVGCKERTIMNSIIGWIRRYPLNKNVNQIHRCLNEEEGKAFSMAYEKNQEFCNGSIVCRKAKPAVCHFQKTNVPDTLFDDNNNWFSMGVSTGRIATPYVNLAQKGTFSGSWVIFDEEKEDAMLPALDIIIYIYTILTNEQEPTITFIGRKTNESSSWEIKKKFDVPISNKSLFKKSLRSKGRQGVCANNNIPDLFGHFLREVMPDFNVLKSAPEDCWMLMITLGYYWQKNADLNLVYSVILSYIMLGPVSKRVGLIKRSNFISKDAPDEDSIDEHGLSYQDCLTAVDSLMDLFYIQKKSLDRSVLHSMAEFQHCLQHMNYLYRLCGQKALCTVYHKTLNSTFMYNIYMEIKDKINPMIFIEKRLNRSSVFKHYQKIVSIFDCCVNSTV